MSILVDYTLNYLCQIPVFSAKAGSSVSFMQLLKNKGVEVGVMEGHVCVSDFDTGD